MAKQDDIALDPAEPFARAAARVVRVRADELVDALDGVLDTSDIEKVHDARVASRRLRAVLEIFAPAFPKKRHADALKEVKRLADALGERRDPDVHLAGLAAFREQVATVQRPGLDSLMRHQLAQQERGNVAVARMLERLAERDLRAQLHELADAAAERAGDEPELALDPADPPQPAPVDLPAEGAAPEPGPEPVLEPVLASDAGADPASTPDGAAADGDGHARTAAEGTPLPDPPRDAEPVPLDPDGRPVQPAEPDPQREPEDGHAQDAQDAQVPG